MRLVPAVLLLLSSCSGGTIGEAPTDDTEVVDTDVVDTDVEDTDSVDTDLGPAPDYALAGPAPVERTDGSLRVDDRCQLSFDRFRPRGEAAPALVVLSHGFARDKEKMHGWAEHLASWGVEVVTPQLCFLSFGNTDHPANGRSVAALARELADGRPVVLAGHSAGGLASTLAAPALDGAHLFTLDGVDNDRQGEDAARDIDASAGGLFAEPAQCNDNGSGKAMLAPIDDRVSWRIRTSDHCHFENPTDGLCTALCRRGDADHEAIAATVRALTTGFVLWKTGVDPRGQDVWTPGTEAFLALPAELDVP